MAFPTFDVRVDWDANGAWTGSGEDVSADTTAVSYQRGASFEGIDAQGTCTITLNNITGKYTRDSGVAPGAATLPGRAVWVKATYATVEYALFYGVIRRVFLDTVGKTASLYCEDPMYALSRAEANVTLSTTRSIRDFRGQILDDAGFTAGQRNLAYGVETNVPPTFADHADALSLLSELNTATSSIHYIKPLTTADLFAYTTIDRASLQSAGVQTAINDETSTIVDASAFDLTDEAVINTQRVTPQPLARATARTTVATFDGVPFSLAAGESRDVWLSYGSVTDSALVAYTATTAVTVALNSFGNTGKVAFTAGSAVTVTALSVTGYAYSEANLSPAVVTQPASITTYGVRAGNEITSPYIVSTSDAEGIGTWVIYRYADARMRPSITVQNDFPAVFTREVGQVASLDYARASLASQRCFIRHLSADIDGEHKTWRTTYSLEEAPDQLDLVTIGGTAAQGVGGTAVLGF